MATGTATAARKLVKEFLLGDQVEDVPSQDEFEAQFAPKFRGTSLLADMYTVTCGYREEIRDAIAKNIATFCKTWEEEVGSRTREAQGISMERAVAMLNQRDLELDEEIEDLEDMCSTLRDELETLNDHLNGDALDKLVPDNIDLDLIKKARDQIVDTGH